MKLFLRKSWRWLVPLIIVLVMAAPIVSLFLRHAAQRRTAEKIAELGGYVHVRREGSTWLFRFASDDCRALYPEESMTADPWGPEWLRKVTAPAGVDALIKARTVAIAVDLKVEGPTFERISPSALLGSDPREVSTLFSEISQLATVRVVTIHCSSETDFGEHFQLDFQELPRTLENLYVMVRGTKLLKIDLTNLPPQLKQLHIDSGELLDFPTDFKVLPSLANLRILELAGFHLKDSTLAEIANCKSLRKLSISRCHFSEAGAAHLGRLTKLRSMHLESDQLNDQGLQALLALEYLKEAHLRVGGQASESSIIKLRNQISDVSIQQRPGAPLDEPLFTQFDWEGPDHTISFVSGSGFGSD